ncbi:MAG: DsbA family protein [Candidatus Acidiferrales bacterium]
MSNRSGKEKQGRSAQLTLLLCCVSLALLIVAGVRVNAASSAGQHHLHPVRYTGYVRAAELPAPIKAYGSSGAPIKMEVFTDYECPMCRNLFEQTLRPLIANYVASGKVYLVHHDYPLDLAEHKYSAQAARWANIAAQFGQFEAAEQALYDNQAAWGADGNIAKYMAAVMPSVDFNRIEKVAATCEPPGPKGRPGEVMMPPHSCEPDAYIEQDIQMGNAVPVNGTPTYVITYKGQKLPAGSGFVSWPVLKQFFDNLLRQ